MNNILFLSDLDGTLLDKVQTISSQNAEAVRNFKQMGGRFTFATGRIEESVAPFIKQLNIDVPVILYNGAKIYCPQTESVLYEKGMSILPDLWDYFLDKISTEIAMLVYKNGKVYTLQHTDIVKKYALKDGVNCLPLSRETLEESVTKIMFIGSDPALLKPIEIKVKESGMPCEMVYSESQYLEVLPKGATKGAALEELIRILGIEGIETVGVGDNLNDLTMIKQADHGYAVGNAHPQLIEAADAVTVDHEHHAIAAIIKQLIEQKNK